MIRTNLIDIVKKAIFWDKSLNVYVNGDGNDYPERHERLRCNSVSASMASLKMQQFLIGLGFGDVLDNLLIGKERLIDISEDIARDITNERGVAVHVRYNSLFEIADFSVIPFKKVRVGVKDDRDYNGKILVYEDWTKTVVKSKVRVYDVYNPNKKVIESQVRKANGDAGKDKKTPIEKLDWNKYKGQVFYFNMDRQYYYPLCRIDSVALECDNEFLASVYKNRSLRKGFFGKMLVITRPLIGAKMKKDTTPEGRLALRNAESEREKFRANINNFIGADNVGDAMHVEVDFAGEKLEDAILIKNVDSNINDKMFEYTEKSAAEKILAAFNNLPISLVRNPDNSLFGNSGESLRELRRMYQENTSKERDILERILNELFKRTDIYVKQGKPALKVKKLIEDVAPATPAPTLEPKVEEPKK